MTTYFPREMTPRITEALRHLPVVVLSGLRQSGKSTLLTGEEALRQRSYLTLDDYPTLESAWRDPDGLLAGERALTIDEAQRCPDMLPAVKAAVDRRRRHGRFLLSGSVNLSRLAQVSETLAGRAVYLALHPMTRREVLANTGRAPALIDFLQREELPSGGDPIRGEEILVGGLPPVCLGGRRGTAVWFRGYAQTYVERDLRQLSQITNLIAFRTLVNLAALGTAQVLNVSQLARDAKLTADTAARYLQLLETSFLIRRLPPYMKNQSSRLIKSPKLYFTDSGLAAHLAGVTTLDRAAADPLHGALLETWVVQNFSALLDAHWPHASLCYWHEQGRHEVDLVVEAGRKVWAFEVKAASRWSESDLSGLKAFVDRTPQCAAAVLAYNGRSAVKLGKKMWAIPLGQLLA